MYNDMDLDSLTPPPDFQPDAASAWQRIQPRLQAKAAGRWPRWAVAATILLAATLAVPAGQYLWQWMTLSRVEIVRLDIDSVMTDLHFLRGTQVSGNGPVEPVKDIAAAEARLGYRPYLPAAGTFAQPPQLTTWPGMTSRATVDTNQLQTVLARKGVAGESVPGRWNGKDIVVHVGPLAFATWPGDYTLAQGKPIRISPSPEIDLAHLVRLILRATGANADQAGRLARTFQDNPAWLWGIPAGEPVEIREVRLREGTGRLVTDFGDNNKPERSALLWHTADRVFALSGPPGDSFLIAAANAIAP
jgi:hypothetical protein